MGIRAPYICLNCKNEFMASYLGGFLFDLLRCENCDTTMEVEIYDKERRRIEYDIKALACPKCGGRMCDDLGPQCPKCRSRRTQICENPTDPKLRQEGITEYD